MASGSAGASVAIQEWEGSLVGIFPQTQGQEAPCSAPGPRSCPALITGKLSRQALDYTAGLSFSKLPGASEGPQRVLRGIPSLSLLSGDGSAKFKAQPGANYRRGWGGRGRLAMG